MSIISPVKSRVSEYVQLTRPRIVLMVLFSMAVAAWCCGDTVPGWLELWHAIAGTALITGGSVALNQWYEQRSDALMARTQNRPIPTGRISSRHGLTFGVGLSLAGLLYLLIFSRSEVAAVATLSWVFYVACYTPLKAYSVWQLPVGAIAGAMPMIIGAAVTGATWSPLALTLFGVVFFWQFPHAIAIAWLYRDHYARANLQVASVRDPSGRLSGQLSVLGAVLLLPVSLLPLVVSDTHWIYGVVATAAGIYYLGKSLTFMMAPVDPPARRMLWASFLYLPLILVALLITTN